MWNRNHSRVSAPASESGSVKQVGLLWCSPSLHSPATALLFRSFSAGNEISRQVEAMFFLSCLMKLKMYYFVHPPPHKASAINVAQCRLSIPWFFKCLLLCLDNVTLLSHERASNGSSSRNHFSDPMQRGRSGTSCSSCQRQRQWTQVKMEIVYSLGCSGTMQWEVGKSKQGM